MDYIARLDFMLLFCVHSSKFGKCLFKIVFKCIPALIGIAGAAVFLISPKEFRGTRRRGKNKGGVKLRSISQILSSDARSTLLGTGPLLGTFI